MHADRIFVKQLLQSLCLLLGKIVIVFGNMSGAVRCSQAHGLTGPIAERSKSSDLDCGRGPGFKSRQG